MICKNCGSENFAENASVCGFCDLPLNGADTEAPAEREFACLEANNDSKPIPIVENTEVEDTEEEYTEEENTEEEKINLSDPIDFIMNQPEPEISLDNKDDSRNYSDFDQSIEPESAQPMKKDFNLFDLSTTPAASSNTDDIPEPARQEPQYRPTQRKPEPVAVGVGNSSPAFGGHDFGAIQNSSATKKIHTENIDRECSPSLSIQQPGTEKIENTDMPRIARSKGIVFLSGDSLILTGGVKAFNGDEVRIGDKLFEVRSKPKNNNKVFGLIAGAIVILGIILAYFAGFIPFGSGRLIGVVLGSGNYPLSDMVVRIAENNKSVTTNQAGFFIFDGLESGLYTVQVLKNGEPIAEERIAVLDNEITTITLFESKSTSYTPTETRSPPKTKAKEASIKADTNFGTLKLSISPKKAKAYLDDKPVGTGSDSYNIKPGQYVLSVKNKGYKTKSRKITVKAGKTLSYDFVLTKEVKGKEKTDREQAYQNEVAGQYDEALRYYDKVLSKSPKDLWAITGKARCFRAQGLIDQSITLYSQAAAVAASTGDVAAQIDALTAIIEIRPNTITAFSGRADIYFDQGEYLQAAADYETVMKLDRRNLGAIYKLGNSYYYARDYNNAVSAFKAAEELNFADPNAQVCQAKTYLMMGDKKSMKKAYERCKELTTYAARLEFKNDPDWQKVLAALGVDE